MSCKLDRFGQALDRYLGIVKVAEPPGAEARGHFSGEGPAATVPADRSNLVRKVSPASQQMGRTNQAQELLGGTAPGYLEQQAGFGTPASVSNMTQLDDLMGGGKIVTGAFLEASPSQLASWALGGASRRATDFRTLGILTGMIESKLAEEEAQSPGKKLVSGARSAAASVKSFLSGIRSAARDTASVLAQPTGRTVYTPRGAR